VISTTKLLAVDVNEVRQGKLCLTVRIAMKPTAGTTGDRFLFSGREFDTETGLYYFRTRYYDPNLGRFISIDPLSLVNGEFNAYLLASNDPINGRDPIGLTEITENSVIELNLKHIR
jgi:RHS repeat-associated protein